jgi:nicotinamide-nucleotide amidase
MIVEVVAVGTELLLGQIVNGNAAHIGAALAQSGFDANHQQVVGDNLGRLESALRLAISRSDAVIITGGIGPTQDDMTREGICAATGRDMRFSDEYAVALRTRFADLGREMPESNLRQAEYPDGAELLPNPKGTAPGLVLDHEGTLIFAVPGVPREMEQLLAEQVLPRIRAKAGVERVLRSRVIRTWGRGEAAVGELCDDLYRQGTNPSIAFLASDGEIKVRITASAGSLAEADRLIAPIEAEVVSRLAPAVFGFDDDSIESILLGLLVGRGWTLGTAESATGGMVASRITSVSGASAAYRGSIVAYDVDEKRRLLGITDTEVESGVVSEAMALAMAQGAREHLGVDVAISVTGAAGPDAHDAPAGTMIVAVATPEDAQARTLRLPGDRERVRTYTATSALHLARLAVSGVWWDR